MKLKRSVKLQKRRQVTSLKVKRYIASRRAADVCKVHILTKKKNKQQKR